MMVKTIFHFQLASEKSEEIQNSVLNIENLSLMIILMETLMLYESDDNIRSPPDNNILMVQISSTFHSLDKYYEHDEEFI